MILLRTRLGRYALLVLAGVAAIVLMNPSFIPNGANQAQPESDHRPPATARDGEVISLAITWAANKRPDTIGWSIDSTETYVDMSKVPDAPPQFVQSMPYDHTRRYEVWAEGRRPLHCDISIDGVTVDHDSHVAPPPPRQAAGHVDGDVHCWVVPL